VLSIEYFGVSDRQKKVSYSFDELDWFLNKNYSYSGIEILSSKKSDLIKERDFSRGDFQSVILEFEKIKEPTS
jgi:hypothetical protein